MVLLPVFYKGIFVEQEEKDLGSCSFGYALLKDKASATAYDKVETFFLGNCQIHPRMLGLSLSCWSKL